MNVQNVVKGRPFCEKFQIEQQESVAGINLMSKEVDSVQRQVLKTVIPARLLKCVLARGRARQAIAILFAPRTNSAQSDHEKLQLASRITIVSSGINTSF